MIYQKLFENEIPDKFSIPVTDIEFKPLFGQHEDEVKHSNPAEFMSKIIYIIKYYISKHKGEVFSFSGSTRDNETENKPTTRIKIYQKLISKFIKPENILRLPNKIIFFTESKKLQELDLITNLNKKSVSKVKSKIVKTNYYLQDIKYKFNSDQSSPLDKFINEFNIEVLKNKIPKNEIVTNIYYDGFVFLFIQVDKNLNKNGWMPFLVKFPDDEITSKKLEKFDLENSDLVSKLNSKGKLKEI